MILEEDGATGPVRPQRIRIGSTTGAAEADVSSAYPGERQEHRDRQCGGHEKDIPARPKIANNTQNCRRRQDTDGVEALIATESFGERVMPDQPQTYGGNSRTKDAAGHALDDSRSKDGWEVLSQPEDQCREDESRSSGCYQRSL